VSISSHAAVSTQLNAIFVSLELSRSTWLVTSLSPGQGERISRHQVKGGDVPALIKRFAQLQAKVAEVVLLRGELAELCQRHEATVLRLLGQLAPLGQAELAHVGHLPLGLSAEYVPRHHVPSAGAVLFSDHVVSTARTQLARIEAVVARSLRKERRRRSEEGLRLTSHPCAIAHGDSDVEGARTDVTDNLCQEPNHALVALPFSIYLFDASGFLEAVSGVVHVGTMRELAERFNVSGARWPVTRRSTTARWRFPSLNRRLQQ